MKKSKNTPHETRTIEPMLGHITKSSTADRQPFNAISLHELDEDSSFEPIDLSLDDDDHDSICRSAIERLRGPQSKRGPRSKGKNLTLSEQRAADSKRRQKAAARRQTKQTLARAKPQTASSGKSPLRSKVGLTPLNRSLHNTRAKPPSIFAKRVSPAIRFSDFGQDENHPDGKFIKNLWACQTVVEVQQLSDKWARSFAAKCREAITRRKLPDEMREKIETLIDGCATSAPNMLNPKVLTQAWEHCFRLLWAIAQANPDFEFALVTIIDGKGGTSVNAPFIELYQPRNKAQWLVKAMAPNFLGIHELAMFKSHTHADGGRHLQGHQHILIYGEDIIKNAKRVAEKRMASFEPNITSAPQIDVRRVSATEVNLARICAYLFKPPHKSMNWVPARGDKKGFMNQTEKGDRLINYLRLAQIRSLLGIEDVLFAGGTECKAIKSDLVKLVRQTCQSDVPMLSRKLHPDGIASFWNEAFKALKHADHRLPVIGRNP